MWPTDSEVERSLYIDETPMEAYERRMRWRHLDAARARNNIARARAFSRGRRRLGCAPLYPGDASEESIQAAIKLLNFASWRHHTEGDSL